MQDPNPEKPNPRRRVLLVAAVAVFLVALVFFASRLLPPPAPEGVLRSYTALVNRGDWAALAQRVHPQEAELCGWTPAATQAVLEAIDNPRRNWSLMEQGLDGRAVSANDQVAIAQLLDPSGEGAEIAILPNGQSWGLAAGTLALAMMEDKRNVWTIGPELAEILRKNDIRCMVIVRDDLAVVHISTEQIAASPGSVTDNARPITTPLDQETP